MESKIKGSMMLMLSFLLVVFCARAEAAEVDRDEFNTEWKEAYEELKAIDPEAAKAFLDETKAAFQEGEIGYVAEEPKGPTADTGRRVGPDADRPVGPGPGPGRRVGPDADRPVGPHPGGPGAHPGPGPTTGAGYVDEVYLKDVVGLNEDEISKVRKANETLSAEAEEVEWENLTPEEARVLEQSFADRFKEITGHAPEDLFAGPPPGAPIDGPAPPGGPGTDFTHYGPGPEGHPEGPIFEGPAGPYFDPAMHGGPYEGPGPEAYGPEPPAGFEHFGPEPPAGFEHIGPGFDGPMPEFEGPMPEFEAPMFEAPIDDRPFEFEPPAYEPPVGEIFDDGEPPPPEEDTTPPPE